jgi:hypothetical protein
VPRGVFRELRRLDRPLGGAQRQFGLLARGGGEEPFFEQPCLALEVGLCLIALRHDARDLGLGAQMLRFGRADARLQLPDGTRIEQRGRGRHEQRHHLPALDRVARLEPDPLEVPGERSGDEVALAHPRLAVVRHRLLEHAFPDRRQLDRHRRRPQRPHRHRGDRREEDAQRHLVACLHSRVFRTATRSRLSMRLRTINALATPAAATTAPA